MDVGNGVFIKALFTVRFLKTDPKARYQGYTFFFKEGFCWNNVLTTYIRCRQKQKTVQSTESMSFFSMIDSVPEFYMITIMNSSFAAFYIDTFVNSTSHCTTGDAKLIPMVIPTQKALETIKPLFEKAVELKKSVANGSATERQISVELQKIEHILNEFVNHLYSI